MCGIAGLWDLNAGQSEAQLRETVSRMTTVLRHRGPDDSGAWASPSTGVALGQRRLSIIDLSPLGHQPMAYAGERYQVVFNGEIYNHAELRVELEKLGHAFRSHSDTEVLLAACAEWGVAAAVSRFIGMFAFALWDQERRRLTLVRDRLGIKPLYYGWAGRRFIFASELKALRQVPDAPREIDREALALFLRHGYVPGPRSIYRDIFKLQPGCMIEIDARTRAQPTAYWSLARVIADARKDPFRGSEDEAVAELDRQIRDAVRLRMIADVPLGAFLSGGIDSSLVVALMQAQSSRPVKTFTIGFDEQEYNEAEWAKKVAQHLGTEHTECYVRPEQAREVIPRLPDMFDEPFADSSQIPTFLVSQLARQHVTVCLSGDGGDELFGGYSRYPYFDDIWRKLNLVPAFARVPAGRVMALGLAVTPERVARHLRTRVEAMRIASPGDLYARYNIHWPDSHTFVRGAAPVTSIASEPQSWPRELDRLSQWMYVDTVSYLPDDILVKVDRASMAVSLEARVPLIDHRVVSLAWRMPLRWKLDRGKGKLLLRRLLAKYVPESLFERPKMGFGVPIDHWLRGPLRAWAEDLLDEKRLAHEGFFEPLPIRKKWQEHIERRADWHYHLWDILMFQAWYAANR